MSTTLIQIVQEQSLTEPLAIGSHKKVKQAIRLMQKKKVDSLLVVTDIGKSRKRGIVLKLAQSWFEKPELDHQTVTDCIDLQSLQGADPKSILFGNDFDSPHFVVCNGNYTAAQALSLIEPGQNILVVQNKQAVALLPYENLKEYNV